MGTKGSSWFRLLVGFLLLWALLAWSCGGKPGAVLPSPTPAMETTPISPPRGGEAMAGEALYRSQGCSACHQARGQGGGVGPSWDGLYGSRVKLATGQEVMANESYIRESIIDPNAKIVAGFSAGLMPADFGKRLSARDIDSLVAFIVSLAAK